MVISGLMSYLDIINSGQQVVGNLIKYPSKPPVLGTFKTIIPVRIWVPPYLIFYTFNYEVFKELQFQIKGIKFQLLIDI